MTRFLCRTTAAALAITLAGCGSSSSPSSEDDASSPTPSPTPTPSIQVLTEDEVRSALLTTADLGPDFRETDATPTDDAPPTDDANPGCLSALDLEGPDAQTEAEIEFEDAEGVEVTNGVGSYGSEEELAKTLTDVHTALEGCTSVEEEQDGVTVSLSVEVDAEKNADADQQLTVLASGTGTAEGLEIPVSMSFSAARLGNNLTFVGVFEFTGSERLFSYTDTAIARLDAVMKGQPVPTPEG